MTTAEKKERAEYECQIAQLKALVQVLQDYGNKEVLTAAAHCLDDAIVCFQEALDYAARGDYYSAKESLMPITKTGNAWPPRPIT